MKSFLLLLASLLPALGVDITFLWSPNPTNEQVGGYQIFEQLGSPPAWVKIIDVGTVTNAVRPNVTDGWHVFSMGATNIRGLGPMSQPVSVFVPPLPSPVTNIMINLRADIKGNTPRENISQLVIGILADRRYALYRAKVQQTSSTNLLAEIQSGVNGPWILEYSLPIRTTKTYASVEAKLYASK